MCVSRATTTRIRMYNKNDKNLWGKKNTASSRAACGTDGRTNEPARIGWLVASAFPTRRPAISGQCCARAAHISLSLSPLQDISRLLRGSLSSLLLALFLAPVLSTSSEKFCLRKQQKVLQTCFVQLGVRLCRRLGMLYNDWRNYRVY